MPGTESDITLGELRRSVAALTLSIESLHRDLVAQKVYDADNRRVDDRFRAIEKVQLEAAQEQREQAKERRADRRIMYAALASGGVAVLLTVVERTQGVG